MASKNSDTLTVVKELLETGGRNFNKISPEINSDKKILSYNKDHGKIFENRVKILLSLAAKNPDVDEEKNKTIYTEFNDSPVRTFMQKIDMYPEQKATDKWDIDPEHFTKVADIPGQKQTFGSGISIKHQVGICKTNCSIENQTKFDLSDAYNFWLASSKERWYFLTGIYDNNDDSKAAQLINIIEMGPDYYEYIWGRKLADDQRDEFGKELDKARQLIKSLGEEKIALFRVLLYYGSIGTTVDYFCKKPNATDKRFKTLLTSLQNDSNPEFSVALRTAYTKWMRSNKNDAAVNVLKQDISSILKLYSGGHPFLKYGFCPSGVLRQLNFLLGTGSYKGSSEHKTSRIQLGSKFSTSGQSQYRIQGSISIKDYAALFKKAKAQGRSITLKKTENLKYLFEPIKPIDGVDNNKIIKQISYVDYNHRGGGEEEDEDDENTEADFLLEIDEPTIRTGREAYEELLKSIKEDIINELAIKYPIKKSERREDGKLTPKTIRKSTRERQVTRTGSTLPKTGLFSSAPKTLTDTTRKETKRRDDITSLYEMAQPKKKSPYVYERTGGGRKKRTCKKRRKKKKSRRRRRK